MIDETTDPGPPSAAERRLVQLLGVLRADPPTGGENLPARVVRAARWQQALRSAVRVGGWMSSAASGALGLLSGRGAKRGPS